MTLYEVLKEYAPAQKLEYGSNAYSDARKKLLLAFECVGLFDMEIFKSENGKDYSFLESSKEYLFHLLKMETSRLFRNIKGNKMTMEDYLELVKEVELLFDFIKPYAKNEEDYKRITSEISANVRYPIIKRYSEFQADYHTLSVCCDSLVKNDGEVTEIDYWECLTEDDKLGLLNELIEVTKKWVSLAERLGEYRSDEIMQDIEKISLDDVKVCALVDAAIEEEYYKKYTERFQPTTRKSRNIKAAVRKILEQDKEADKLKMDLAKKFCEEHGIDFQQYLAEKDTIENYHFDHVSTEEAIRGILREML